MSICSAPELSIRSGGVPWLKRGWSVDWIFWVGGELDLRLREVLLVDLDTRPGRTPCRSRRRRGRSPLPAVSLTPSGFFAVFLPALALSPSSPPPLLAHATGSSSWGRRSGRARPTA